MVRYSDCRPGGIFWGYFDDNGKFVGQGYANVSPPSDVSHTLRVVSGDKSYDVYLDDFLLAADVPLLRNYGYAGMITVQTAAEYESAQIGGPQRHRPQARHRHPYSRSPRRGSTVGRWVFRTNPW